MFPNEIASQKPQKLSLLLKTVFDFPTDSLQGVHSSCAFELGVGPRLLWPARTHSAQGSVSKRRSSHCRLPSSDLTGLFSKRLQAPCLTHIWILFPLCTIWTLAFTCHAFLPLWQEVNRGWAGIKSSLVSVGLVPTPAGNRYLPFNPKSNLPFGLKL